MAREIVVGASSPPIPTGQMVYRVTIPARELQGIEELKEIVSVPRNNHWLGPNGTVLSYLLAGGEAEALVNLVLTCDVQMPDGVNQRPGDMSIVLTRFANWYPQIVKILERVGEVLEWRLFTHSHLSTWVHSSGKLCLIGDAAHAMTPYLAQGAAMGIEDAFILGSLLSAYPSPSILPQTLHRYEELRIERAKKVAHASIDSRWFTQMEDGLKQEERDEYLLEHPGIGEGHRNIRQDRGFLGWLFGYDAYKTLEGMP